MKLPEWDDCEVAVDSGKATPLQTFIYNYECCVPDDKPWRESLGAALDDAFKEGVAEGDTFARHPEFGAIYADDGEVTQALQQQSAEHVAACELTEEDHEEILNRAYTAYGAYQRGVRGQTITMKDALDYWTAAEAAKLIRERLEGKRK